MKYKQYSKYKDSGVEWIGEIPEGWEVNRLKFLCNITTGTKNTEDNESEGDYPFFVRSQKVEKISTYSCDEEAVLTAGDGVGVGKVFHYVNGKFDFHQRVYKMSDFKKILGKYFFYYFQENFKKEIFKGTAKSTVDSIRLHMIQDFPISFGSEEDQIQILEFLKKQTTQFDELIAKSKTQITLLEEKKQATINQAVTKGLDPSVKMKDSGIEWIGEIPEHWEVKKLKHTCSLITDGSHYSPTRLDEGYPFATVTNMTNDKIDINSCFKISKSDYENLVNNNCQPMQDDVLFSKDGTIGQSFVFTQPDEIVLLSSIAIIRTRRELLLPSYLNHIIKSNLIKIQIFQLKTGAALTRLILDNINNFQIILPPRDPIDEQEKISDFLDKQTTQLDELIAKSKTQITLLEEKRQALITAAVTGKIDVRGEIAV